MTKTKYRVTHIGSISCRSFNTHREALDYKAAMGDKTAIVQEIRVNVQAQRPVLRLV